MIMKLKAWARANGALETVKRKRMTSGIVK
jgi:hypothetical protein